ncbi:hypothetical protein [Acidocella sp.]|uniref:hypothetical protein n=1 Tax=Acidocella sp. TaxID=50710 RepID=UPI003D03D1C7
MNGAARLGVPFLAMALALLLAAEWLTGSVPPTPRLALSIPGGMPGVALDDAVSQWADTALARPLFSESRRPADDAALASGTARLSAIIISSDGRSAIFAADGQKPRIVPEGGEIDGYRLSHILADTVELAGPSGTLTLHPQFAPPKAAPPSPTPPPPAAADYDNE